MFTRKTSFVSFVAALFVVLGFVASTAQAQYTWLRQTGNSNPGGSGVYQNGMSAAGGGSYLPFLITNNTGQALQLSHGSMGVATYSVNGLKTSGIYAQAWTPASFFANPPTNNGDLVGRASVSSPTITLVGNSSIFGQPITNYTASWDPGELLGLNFILAPGQTAYFTIAVDNQSAQSGRWFVRESSMTATSDTLWQGSMGYQPFSNISWTEYDGYLEGDWAFVPVVPTPSTIAAVAVAGPVLLRRRHRLP
jgi:hypothetical protein